MTRRVVMIAALVAAAGCNEEDAERFEASLTGAAETPPVSTTAVGNSSVTLGDDQTSFRINVQGLNNATVAHIHSGAPGQAGPPVVFLFQASTPVSLANGTLSAGSFDATDMIPAANISYDSLLSLIRNGNAYVNVHTTAHPPGEIRGQLTRD